ncbi:MAG: hypothetical protein VX837_02970, partial [Candidatus Thermoplasmatota archaeon]|nr:hypothetical protein [Candidatus Thermoplasmatota archaeon]
ALAAWTNSATNTYTATYTVAEGNTNRAGGATTLSITLTDAAGNSNYEFTTLTESSAQTIDANSPAATTSATVTGGTAKVGDQITITVVASEGSLTCSTCTMNGVTLTNWVNTGGSTYTGRYTVVEGNTDRAASASNFISLVLSDAAGNTNAAYTTLTESSPQIIDANSPAVSSATVAGGTKKIGDAFTITIVADAAGYTLSSGTMNGVAVTGFSDETGGNYEVTYTVVEGHTDRAAGATPISIVLADTAGNTNTAHTALTESSALVIDATKPAATTSATVAGGVTAKVGDTVTITVVASEGSLLCQTCTMNGGTLTSWTNTGGSTYTGVYTVVEGQTDRNAAASNFISL